MALATVCPHCKTTFRVASDQLKLRGGIVRCGTCREIFDGNAALVDLDAALPPTAPIEPVPEPALPEVPDLALAPEPEPKPAPEDALAPETIFAIEPDEADEPDEPSLSDTFDEQIAALDATAPLKLAPGYVLDFDLSEPDPRDEAASEPGLQADRDAGHEADDEVDDKVDEDPTPAYRAELELSVADEGDLSLADEPEDWPSPGELEKAAPDHDVFSGPLPLLRASAGTSEDAPASQFPTPPPAPRAQRPARAARAPRHSEPAPAPLPEADEPDFVRLGREKEEAARRRRLTMGVGAALLALTLFGQGVLTFRNVLAARYPAMKPVLATSCKLLGCKIELPAQIETMVLDTGELQSLGGGTFQLTTLLRNESALTQAWPYLELELTDAADKPLVRRVFTPAQYLPPALPAARGFNGRSEQSVKIVFELKQLKASGFHIAVFYP